jgi:signal transduction histidine kinase
MKADDDLSLVEKGQERQTVTMRAKVHWALVAMAVLGVVPGLMFANSPLEIWVTLGVVLVAAIASVWVADYLMAPVAVLKRRLEVKNYGDQVHEEEGADVNLANDGFELAAMLLSMSPARNVDINAGLPVELAAIERLARAGRVSEIAMETVKRDLFRHLSHQLKSPLALIQAHARTAEGGVEDGDSEAIRQALKAIEAIGQNMSGLVEQMLAMAWVEGLEEQGISGRKANISAAIMELVSLRERAAQDKQIRIETHVEAGLWVKGQQQLLQEMVVSLVDNSIRYAPEASTIFIEAKRLPSTRTVVVVVVDRGPGIPLQERERVFEPFYGSIGLDARGIMTYGTRRHRALGPGVSKSSHGLGLALVRAVAKLHGATVTLDSGPGGVGLLARIALTATDPPGDGEPAPHSAPAALA